MEVVSNINGKLYTINFNYNVIFFGQSNSNKCSFINHLIENFTGKRKEMLIDGKKPDLNDYNVLVMNEETDFSNEFKFTKNNLLKQLIYNDIIKTVNEDKIIKYTNELFDVIDDKVNKLLDRKINKRSDTNLNLQIEIPNLNAIIDKFTNVYIDDLLLNSDDVSKAMKRKLLYKLYFLDIKNKSDKTNIIIINNFDAYLNSDEIIDVLESINQLSGDKCHFILTTSSNLFEYLALDKFSVYKITQKLLSINLIEQAISSYFMQREYKLTCSDISFEEFYQDNEHLIIREDIEKTKEMLFSEYPHLISKILNANEIKVVFSKPKMIYTDYIICSNKDMQLLFLEICKYFIDLN